MLLILADVTQGNRGSKVPPLPQPLMIYGKSSDLFLLSEVCNPILAVSLCGCSSHQCVCVSHFGCFESFHLDGGFLPAMKANVES